MSHDHGASRYDRAFAIGVALNLGFVVVEAVFGVMAHSLALLADSGHNLSDVVGLLLAWGASVLARRAPTPRRTYGWRGSSILAALFNAVFLLIAVGAIAWEAIRRFEHPMPVATGTVIWVAAVGIGINSATAMLFFAGRKRDLNVRGAFLHMAADAAVSLGVVIAGMVMAKTGWSWVDPVTSLAIVAVITVGTWGLLRESLNLALHAVPEGVDPQAVHAYLASLPGVVAVHDLHIWSMSTTEVALTGHIVKPELANDDALLTHVSQELHDRFEIAHATLQVERDASHFCSLAPDAPTQRKAEAGR
jgi:cobalt-zinc-cadmium efflux system protein